MESCDVLVVGGGPAGSSCARQLRGQGLDVVVMDRASFPRDKVCAGWITPQVLDLLELDSRDYAAGRVLQPITGFRTGLVGGSALDTPYAATVSHAIRRCEFDDYLLRRSGARLRLGEALESMARRGGLWLANGSLATPLIVGAGGHSCPVARFLGAKVGAGEATVAAKEIEFEMTPAQLEDCLAQPGTPELYFCRDFKGYGWCIRKDRWLNVGLGREGSRGLADELRQFCDFLKQRGRIPRDSPDRFHGHAYLLHGQGSRRLLDDGVLLVGDAAGLASPRSGEGIRPAIESGLLAAAAILEARGDYRRGALAAYESRLQTHLGPPSAASATGPAWARALLARALLHSRWFTRHVVLDHCFLRTHEAA